MKTDNTSHEKDISSADAAVNGHGSVDEGRRRFGRTGVAVSGILLTLSSRPVFGVVSQSPSGFVSGNQSSHGQPAISLGRSPGYWKNHPSSWPMSTSTKFSSVFPCSFSSPYAKYTMMQLLSHQKDDVNNLGMHLVAALLNSRKGWTPFLSEETIKAMFSEWQSKGYFSPIATVQWNSAQIVDYIKATQS